MVLVHTAELEPAEAYLRVAWPEVPAIADPTKALYAAFGLGRGSLGQLFGAGVWKAGLRAAASGHGIGLPVGDPMMMSGDFLVHSGAVVWSSVHRHAGSESDLDEARRVARRLEAS